MKKLTGVEAERFVALLLREPFDYTEWQRNLYKDVPLKDFLDKAMEFRTRGKPLDPIAVAE